MTQERLFKIKCNSCGKNATVPFKPKAEKPVYCRDCFSKKVRYVKRNSDSCFNSKISWARRGCDFRGRKEEGPSSILQKK